MNHSQEVQTLDQYENSIPADLFWRRERRRDSWTYELQGYLCLNSRQKTTIRYKEMVDIYKSLVHAMTVVYEKENVPYLTLHRLRTIQNVHRLCCRGYGISL
jgi:hypothetical protein